MGILKKKITEPSPIEPTRFRKMSDDDVYTVLETGLMEAQYALSQYRKTSREGSDFRMSALEWLKADIATAELACQELISRNT